MDRAGHHRRRESLRERGAWLRLGILLAAGLAGGAVPAPAEELLRVVPGITVRAEYDDNLFFTGDNEMDDFITSISPGAAIEGRSERLRLRLAGFASRVLYADHDELNSWDQDYQGNALWHATPRLSLAGNAGYRRDSRTDRDVDVTGLVLGTNRRERIDFGTAGEYRLSEMTAGRLAYDFRQERFEDAEATDVTIHAADLGLSRRLTRFVKPTHGRLAVGYADYTYENIDIENVTATVGLLRELSEVLSVTADVGGRYTRSDFEAFTVTPTAIPFWFRIETRDVEESGTGFLGSLVLDYRGEVGTASLGASHQVNPASGRNGTTERTAVVLDVDRRFSDYLTGYLSAGYYLNRADQNELAGETIDEETFRLSARLRHWFTRDMFAEAGYVYTLIQDRERDADIHRNLVFAALGFHCPILE